MANAAAKKAAAGRKAAMATYRPLLLGTNLVYVFLRVTFQDWDSILEMWEIVWTLIVWGLQWFAYVGILDDAENGSSGSNSSKKLVGGASLDLLGLTWLVQFGTVLWSPNFYWLLIILPPWGAWKLYSTFGSGLGKNTQSEQPAPPKADEKTTAKRQKRAERRRQKWS